MRGLGFFQRQQGSVITTRSAFDSSSEGHHINNSNKKMIQVLLEENKALKSENKELMDTNERLHDDLQLLRKKSDGQKRYLENILKQQKVSFDSIFHDYENAKIEIEQLKKQLLEAQKQEQLRPQQQQQHQQEQQLMSSSSKTKKTAVPTDSNNNKGVVVNNTTNTKSQSEILQDVMIEKEANKNLKTEAYFHKPTATSRTLSTPRKLGSSFPRQIQRKLSPTSVLQVDFSSCCALDEEEKTKMSSNNEQQEEKESGVIFIPSLTRTPSSTTTTTTMASNNTTTTTTTSSCDITTRRNIEDRKIKIAQMRQRLEENQQRLRSHIEYHDGIKSTDVNLRNIASGVRIH